jgi:Domain of unknown function (DUF5666)
VKFTVAMLTLLLLGATFVVPATAADDAKQDKTAMAGDSKEARWQGHIVRINTSDSSMTVRGGQKNMESMQRQIYFDSSTQWTKQGKPAEQSEFKEGSFVIVLGHPDDKGVFHATRIDLRQPR